MADDLNKKVPMCSDTERAVLGCILTSPDLISQVAGDLNEDAFYDLRNRNIYIAMCGFIR